MSVYDDDILVWSEQQAALLRRLAKNERINDEVDWDNVIEEVESVGRSQLSAVRSHIVQALLHDLKAEAWPQARDVESWRKDAIGFRQDAAEAYSPAMRQRIDMAALYVQALRRLPEKMYGQPRQAAVPDECPVTLDQLLSEL